MSRFWCNVLLETNQICKNTTVRLKLIKRDDLALLETDKLKEKRDEQTLKEMAKSIVLHLTMLALSLDFYVLIRAELARLLMKNTTIIIFSHVVNFITIEKAPIVSFSYCKKMML